MFVHFPADGNGCGEIPRCLQTPPLQIGNIAMVMMIIMDMVIMVRMRQTPPLQNGNIIIIIIFMIMAVMMMILVMMTDCDVLVQKTSWFSSKSFLNLQCIVGMQQ